jgi:hypothetical protein
MVGFEKYSTALKTHQKDNLEIGFPVIGLPLTGRLVSSFPK